MSTPPASRDRAALLVALGIDNFGSGLFLPLAVLYAIRVVGLPVGAAGTLVTVGTVAGALVPPPAGRLVDRIGPRLVVIASQLVQAAGALAYLLAHGVAAVLIASVLLAAGQQGFYSSLFALIADTAREGPKDRAFAVVNRVRSATFAVGALVAAGLLTGAGTAGYRFAVAGDGVSFLVAALVLALLLRIAHVRHHDPVAPVSVLRNRPFLALIVVAGLAALELDVFLVGTPVYVVAVLRGPAWVPGAMLGVLAATGVPAATFVVHRTRRLWRTTAMAVSAALCVLWCLAFLAAEWLPSGARPAYLLAATLPMSAANLIGARSNALAEAAAPRAARGRYLAAFQYAFTAAGMAAPGVLALFSVAPWLPWTVVGLASAAAGCALPYLARHLPRHAVTGQAEPAADAVDA